MQPNELAEEIRTINKANGFKVAELPDLADPYKIPAILALIHSEVSEAMPSSRK